MRHLSRRFRCALLCAIAACSAPQPPNRPPDLKGTVIARTPRLPKPGGDAHLVIASATARVDIAMSRDVRVLEALSDGRYRNSGSDDGWIGRAVEVWFAGDTGNAPGVQVPAGVTPRRAAYVVKAAR